MKTIITILLLLPLACFSQKKWQPFIGVHASMDAGGYYVGPSVQAGTDYQLKKRLALSAYFHYFPEGINTSKFGFPERGKYRSAILAVLIQTHLAKNERKGMFIAGGFAMQRTTEDYTSPYEEIHTKRVIPVAAFRIGYRIPAGMQNLAIEFNAVGPHHSTETDPPFVYSVTEILTQLSFGVRLVL